MNKRHSRLGSDNLPDWLLDCWKGPDLSQLLPECCGVEGASVGGLDGLARLGLSEISRERFAVCRLFHIPWKVEAAPQFPKERLW